MNLNNINDYDNTKEQKIFCEICHNCNDKFYYTENDVWFDNNAVGYSVKLVECPRCHAIKQLQYYEDKNLDVNNDERFYQY